MRAKTPGNGIAVAVVYFKIGPVWLFGRQNMREFPGHVNPRGRTHGRTETATAIRDSISNSFLVLWILIKIFSGLPLYFPFFARGSWVT